MDLTLKVGADIEAFKSELSKVNKNLGGFQSQLKSFAGVVAGAFAVDAIANFTKEIVGMAAEAEAGERQLLTALKGREDVQQRLLAQASLLHNTSLFEDDEIIKQQGLLAALGRNEDQIKAIMSAAVDLATATGKDLGSAVEALGKTYEGVGRSLGAIDPEFKKLTETQLRNGEAIDLVTKKYKGFAEEATTSTHGALMQMQKQWMDIKEELGNEVLPILIKMANALGYGLTKDEQITQLGEKIKLFNAMYANGIKDIELYRSHIDHFQKSAAKLGVNLVVLRDGASKAMIVMKPFAETIKTTHEVTKELTDEQLKQIERQKMLNKLKRESLAMPAMTSISDPGTGVLLQSLTDVSNKIPEVLPKFQALRTEFGSFSEAWASVGRAGIEATDVINNSLVNMGSSLGMAIGDMASGVGGFEAVQAALLSSIGGMAVQLGQLAIATGIAVAGIKKALTSLNPAVAIVGGIALVALGKMVSNKAASIARGGGSGGGSVSGRGASALEGRSVDYAPGQRIVIGGEFKVDGKNLVAAINNQSRFDGRTKS